MTTPSIHTGIGAGISQKAILPSRASHAGLLSSMQSIWTQRIATVVLLFCAVAVQAQTDTLRFIPTLRADGITISFAWYDAGNWYRFDPASQVYVNSGRLPLAV